MRQTDAVLFGIEGSFQSTAELTHSVCPKYQNTTCDREFNWTSYPRQRFGASVTNMARKDFKLVVDTLVANHFGWLYVSDYERLPGVPSGGNYDGLPSYWEEAVEYIASWNARLAPVAPGADPANADQATSIAVSTGSGKPPASNRLEVVAFHASSYGGSPDDPIQQYDWNKVTTYIPAWTRCKSSGAPVTPICHANRTREWAQQHGARVSAYPFGNGRAPDGARVIEHSGSSRPSTLPFAQLGNASARRQWVAAAADYVVSMGFTSAVCLHLAWRSSTSAVCPPDPRCCCR